MWRRSGFWTTSLQALDLDALEDQSDAREPGVGAAGAPGPRDIPDVVTRTLPERRRAGRLVQSAGAVVHVELDPALAERGRDPVLAGGRLPRASPSWSRRGTPSA